MCIDDLLIYHLARYIELMFLSGFLLLVLSWLAAIKPRLCNYNGICCYPHI